MLLLIPFKVYENPIANSVYGASIKGRLHARGKVTQWEHTRTYGGEGVKVNKEVPFKYL